MLHLSRERNLVTLLLVMALADNAVVVLQIGYHQFICPLLLAYYHSSEVFWIHFVIVNQYILFIFCTCKNLSMKGKLRLLSIS